jgi:uncharacterized protein (UPF0332 family)
LRRGAKKHPPKKKHVNRPRPAVVLPISDRDRSIKAQGEFEKAMIHLEEAEKLAAWGGAPNACVHSAYYAMYHCAAAAILASGGVGKHRDVPKSHEHVIEHYGKLVASEAGDLGQSGMVLNRARADRMVADYDLIRGATQKDAELTTAEARKLVDACRGKWSFGAQMIDTLGRGPVRASKTTSKDVL